jgi:hypothetical protein
MASIEEIPHHQPHGGEEMTPAEKILRDGLERIAKTTDQRNFPTFASGIARETIIKADEAGSGEITLKDISVEVERAMMMFPTWPTDPLHAVAVIGEEFGELTQAVLQSVYEPTKSNPEDVRTEAIHTAAMCLRFIASLDKYRYEQGPQRSQRGTP